MMIEVKVPSHLSYADGSLTANKKGAVTFDETEKVLDRIKKTSFALKTQMRLLWLKFYEFLHFYGLFLPPFSRLDVPYADGSLTANKKRPL